MLVLPLVSACLSFSAVAHCSHPLPRPHAHAAQLPSQRLARPPTASLTTTLVPAAGACLANVMFFSGAPEVMKKRAEGELGDFNPLPMPIIFGTTLGWFIYSLLTRDVFVAIANAPGLLLSLWYVTTTIKLAEPPLARRLEGLTLLIAAIHAFAGIASAFLLRSHATTVQLYGLLCNAILMVYYSAPLSSLAKVVRTRSAASIYLPTVAVNCLNGLFWSMYAMAINDRYLLVPNAIGVALATVQAALCFVCRS